MPLDEVQERQALDDLLARLRAEDEALLSGLASWLAEERARTEELLAWLDCQAHQT